jgi:tetrahydromethanopterin S-methyltransferase subunit G
MSQAKKAPRAKKNYDDICELMKSGMRADEIAKKTGKTQMSVRCGIVSIVSAMRDGGMDPERIGAELKMRPEDVRGILEKYDTRCAKISNAMKKPKGADGADANVSTASAASTANAATAAAKTGKKAAASAATAKKTAVEPLPITDEPGATAPTAGACAHAEQPVTVHECVAAMRDVMERLDRIEARLAAIKATLETMAAQTH